MNVTPLPHEFRRRWCVAPGITDAQLLLLRTVRPTGRLGKSASAELRAANIETLADLALCLPEEILSLRGIGPTTVFELQDEIIDRIDTGPLIRNPSDEEITLLAKPETLEPYRAYLPADLSHLMKQAGLASIPDLARASPVDLMAHGFTLRQVRLCRRCMECGIERPSPEEQRAAYARRPMPPGLARKPIKGSRLMLSWVGYALLKERCTTIGKTMTSQPTQEELGDDWDGREFRAKEFHVALAARRLIATIPDGEKLYRVPYQNGPSPNRPLIFGTLTGDERAYLDHARCDPRDDLTTEQEHAFENALYDPECRPNDPGCPPSPPWMNAASTYGMDALGFIADADLPYLIEAANGRKETVCDMLIAVRRALLDHAQPGSADAVYGPEHPYFQFFRAFPKAA